MLSKRDDKGFTLIELMVVVLIIAILIAIAIPTFLGARERAQDRGAQSNLRNALTAAKVLYADDGDYLTSASSTTQMAAVEPSLSFITGASTTLGVISIDTDVTGNEWAGAAMSDSDVCYWINDSDQTGTSYGSGGGSPLQNLIVRGHSATRLSAIRCVDELDAGEIYLQRSLRLDGSAREILNRTAELVVDMIGTILRDRPTPFAQTGEIVRFSRRTPAQSDISGLDNVDAVYDYIRMLDADGYPHAFVEAGGLRLEFTEARRCGSTVQAHVVITKKAAQL